MDAAVAADIERIARQVASHNGNRRDAHVKHHGLVRAEVRILPDLPEQLRHGLFKAPATFQAVIRFSNASHAVGADGARDNHGMAIKLFDVPGEKLLDDEHSTFDLLLVDHPTFFTADPREFADIMRRAATATSTLAKLAMALHHPRAVLRIARMMQVIASPLAATYFSMTAYRLGPQQVVKYLARPVGPSSAQMPAQPGKDYLREALACELAEGERWFDLCVQLRSDPYTMPADDPTVEWSESDARAIPVATIRILKPPADASDPLQLLRAETITFNPWRVTQDHAPLGRFNLLRREIYKAIAAQRQAVLATRP
ncbi:MAG: catalase [Candidatus Binatia bacterium]